MGRKRRAFGKVKVSETEKCSELFEKYYRGLQIVPENEWLDFMKCLVSDLPTTFRVTGFREQSQDLLCLLTNKYLETLMKLENKSDGADQKESEDVLDPVNDSSSKLPTPELLKWYPNNLAWQLNASKVAIRRTIELKKLHQFLISETESGYTSRQEAVSMIPPLLFTIEPHHCVLDMCAAPGSKSAQLIELLHTGCTLDSCSNGGAPAVRPEPSGIVIANDADGKRCYMMVHQLKRLQSPCVVIMRQDATIFPRLFVPTEDGKERQLLFDRILADVPCSGDGTLRKNPDLWKRWSPNLGVAEHFIQAKILRRGLELLNIGGQIVYSTCSLNPIEDEAVVASVLVHCGATVQLLDVRHRLPGLRTCPGLSHWRLMLKDGQWIDQLEDVPEIHRRCIRPSLFPPPQADQLHLDRCMRILPHHQNTGGFFVAVIEKVACLPWMKQNRGGGVAGVSNHQVVVTDEQGAEDVGAAVTEDQECDGDDGVMEKVGAVGDDETEVISQTTTASTKAPPSKKRRVYREDPFYFMSGEDADWPGIKAYYDISDTFPQNQLMFRSVVGKRRNIYYTNPLVRQLVQTNADRGINFINLGVKLFATSGDKEYDGYRLLQEGVQLADSYVGPTRRRLCVSTRVDLLTLLIYDMPFASQLSPRTIREWERCTVGPVLLQYEPGNEGVDGDEQKSESGEEPAAKTPDPLCLVGDPALPRCRVVFTGWRGRTSLRHYVGSHEREHLLRLCGVEEPQAVLPAAAAACNQKKSLTTAADVDSHSSVDD